MSEKKHLTFVVKTIREKIKYRDDSESCPFCDRDNLRDIIAVDGPVTLLENKFPSLADTYQLVLLETDTCDEDLTTYDTPHMRKLITFGIDHWMSLAADPRFKSVVFFKNHGRLSGGSMEHAHMQIVGLKNIDYKENIRDEIFEGIEIHRNGDCLVNISTKPNACSTELNIITKPRNDNYIADSLPVLVKYILKQSSSYNLFFYEWKGAIICKLVARWITSPYYVGYSIPHNSDRVPEIAEELRIQFSDFR